MKFVPLALGFFVALAAVVVIADMGWLRPQDVFWFKDGDKVLHFLLLGTLALLVDLALVQALPRANAGSLAIMGSAVVAALGCAEEFSQLWMPARTPDWYDLLASCAGVVAGTLMALALKDYVRAPKSAPRNTA